jgi:CHAT domain-containing protein/tetratricopeptide (TPR) repeat protein
MKFSKAIVLSLLANAIFFNTPPSSAKTFGISSFKIEQFREYFEAGEKNRKNGDFGEAINSYNKCLSPDAISNLKSEVLEAYIGLGLSQWNTGILKDSEESFRKAASLARELGIRDREIFCLDSVEIHRLYSEAKNFRTNSEYGKSIAAFQKAIDLAKKNMSPDLELKCLRQMSVCYYEINNFPEFYGINQNALLIAEQINNTKEKGLCLNNIGLYFWKITNYSKALENCEKALEIARSINNLQMENECLNNLGIIYKEIGSFDNALSYLNQALEIDEKAAAVSEISKDLNNIGTIYRKKGLQNNNKSDFILALDYLLNSLNLNKEINKISIHVNNNIGTIYSDLEDYSNALKYYMNGLNISEKLNDKEGISLISNNIGIVYYNLGNYEESTKYCQRAIDLASQIKAGQVLWEAYLDVGNSYKKQSKFQDALTSYRESISVIESTRSNIDLEEMKASYFGTDKRIEAYHNLIDLLARLNSSEPGKSYGDEAFTYLERGKARAFLDSLEVAQISVSQGVDAKLANEEKQINADMTALYKKLLMPDLTAEQRNQIEADLKTCEEKYDRLKREIRAENPAYATLSPNIITLKEAQSRLLNGNTVFIAYSVGKESSYGFAIGRTGLRIFPIPPRKEIQKKVTDYLKVISDKDNRDFQLGHELFADLVQPALEPHVKKLFIIPDDALYFLPFETLLLGPDNASWLLRKYNIAYAPSMSSLAEIIKRTRNGAKRNKDLLALGDPDYGFNEQSPGSSDIFQNFYSSSDFRFFRLAYSGIEVQKIAALFPKNREKVLQRAEASEPALKKLPLSDFKIIHFAAHGLIDDQKPARSAIVLSLDSNSQDDGFLQMRDIYGLRLNADLVALSACQTGKGQFVRGEGIEGLSRAFFYAGASSVLMSLWSVNDQATYQLMERFYAHLRSSKSLMDALRLAKLEMMDSKVFAHPFFWAGFVITGDAAKVVFRRSKLPWLTAILALGIGMSVIWGRKRLHFKKRH